ncbi:MAG: hypothetical protein V2A73_10680, partial [Pseudomonadota bacterium]
CLHARDFRENGLLAIDPHRTRSYSKPQMRRYRDDQKTKPFKVAPPSLLSMPALISRSVLPSPRRRTFPKNPDLICRFRYCHTLRFDV